MPTDKQLMPENEKLYEMIDQGLHLDSPDILAQKALIDAKAIEVCVLSEQ